MQMHTAAPTLFSLIFTGIGLALLAAAFKISSKAKRSLSWPSTEGEITHSAVLYQTQTSPSQGQNETYKADIAYRYKVHGRSFSSSKIALVDFSSTWNRAQDLVSRYPDNSKVDVYYDPADPSDCVLEPGASSGLTVMFAIGGLFAAAGVFFLLMSVTGHVHTSPWHTGNY